MNTVRPVWDRMARSLHWLMAALLILQWTTGNWDDLLGVRFHVSLGVIVLLLALFRLLWRLTHKAPGRSGAPTLPDRMAGAVHVLFYLVMLGRFFPWRSGTGGAASRMALIQRRVSAGSMTSSIS